MVDEKGGQTDLVPHNNRSSSPFEANPRQTISGFKTFVERFKKPRERLDLEPGLLEGFRQEALEKVLAGLELAAKFQETDIKTDPNNLARAYLFFEDAGRFAFTFPDSVLDFEMSDQMIEVGRMFLKAEVQKEYAIFAIAELVVALKQIQAARGIESDFEEYRASICRGSADSGTALEAGYRAEINDMDESEIAQIELAFPGEGKRILNDLGQTWAITKAKIEKNIERAKTQKIGIVYKLAEDLAAAKILFPSDFSSLRIGSAWQEIQDYFKLHPWLENAQALLILSTPSEGITNTSSQLYVHPRSDYPQHRVAPQLAEGQ